MVISVVEVELGFLNAGQLREVGLIASVVAFESLVALLLVITALGIDKGVHKHKQNRS